MVGAAEALLAGALYPWLRWRSRPGPVRAALDRLPYEPAARLDLPRVRIATIQFDINLADSAPAYARHAHEMVRRAVGAGASLVVFPEYVTLPLLGLLPGARRLAMLLLGEAGEAPQQEVHAASPYALMALVFRLAAPAARRVHWATFSTLAARFRVTILAGSAIELGGDGHLYNVAYLYGDDGTLLARQLKTHLVPSEVAMGYAVGDEIQVVDTPAGRLAFPVCMDHTYYETARCAALMGADLLIDPSANQEYYNPYAQARGIWGRVQEAQTYGALCCGVGRIAGIVFEGRSGVYAPLGLTVGGDGILAEAQTHDCEEVVVADLDYAALQRHRRQQQLELNPGLYQRYLPEAYGRGLRRNV